MNAPSEERPAVSVEPSRRRSRRYEAGQRIGNLFLAYPCLAVGALVWTEGKYRVAAVFIAMGLGCAIAAWGRLGWLNPCTVLGILGGLQFGVLSNSTGRDGPHELVLFTALGTLFGVCAGILLDGHPKPPATPDSPRVVLTGPRKAISLPRRRL